MHFIEEMRREYVETRLDSRAVIWLPVGVRFCHRSIVFLANPEALFDFTNPSVKRSVSKSFHFLLTQGLGGPVMMPWHQQHRQRAGELSGELAWEEIMYGSCLLKSLLVPNPGASICFVFWHLWFLHFGSLTIEVTGGSLMR